MKVLAWIMGAVLSLLIIASRKHYTVDVVVAWYTVPLVFYTFHRRWTTKRDMGESSSVEPGAESSRDDDDKSARDEVASVFTPSDVVCCALILDDCNLVAAGF